ncbi:MAG: phosphoadenylyl-sulfate reductase [Myxococcales bacterium]|nr:phosphoadenylyl-sulfate reductase [Myxococcales bacterium]
MKPTEADALANRLEHRPPEEILAWAADRFAPAIAFGTGFGREGCVLIDIIGRAKLPVRLFTLDTGLFFEETYALWRTLEARYDITIEAIKPELTLDEQQRAYGDELWQRDPDLCCQLRKVVPLQRVLGSLDAWISAIRRSQTEIRRNARVVELEPRFGRVKINPLVRWSNADIERYIAEHDVPVNALHEQGYPSIGCWPCTSRVLAGEDPRAGRWRGRQKTECGLHFAPASPTTHHHDVDEPLVADGTGGIS